MTIFHRFFVVCLLLRTTHSFQSPSCFPTQRSVSCSSYPLGKPAECQQTALFAATKKPYYYSDDAFGLIFLPTVVLNDAVFSGIFLTISAIAATSVNLQKVPLEKKLVDLLPGIVALVSFALRILVPTEWSTALLSTLDVLEDPMPSPLAFPTEIAVCTVSVVWAVYQYMTADDEPEADA